MALTVQHPSKGQRIDTLVQCPPWSTQFVDVNMVKELFNGVLQEGASRGIFITAGDFSEDARLFASMRPLELIDGQGMLRSLLRLTEEEQDYYLRLATVGQYTVPSCPACSTKMEMREDTMREETTAKDITLKDRQMISDEVVCRTLTIKAGADVQFLKAVWVKELRVEGRASGNITVQGRLAIGSGGVLGGFVAARSIKLDEGGILEAEARILNAAEVVPVQAMPAQYVWRCGTWPRCRGQLQLRAS